jgi:hypothetical protein
MSSLARGVAFSGMPDGAPGMRFGQNVHLQVVSFDSSGIVTPCASI